MTRINLVPVEELSDQHLIAEYHELPRVAKQKISIKGAPDKYCLGKNHMKWARKHLLFTLSRYYSICDEMYHRGFAVKYPYVEFLDFCLASPIAKEFVWRNYNLTEEDTALSRNRLIEKYRLRPDWYRWTGRCKPLYYRKEEV